MPESAVRGSKAQLRALPSVDRRRGAAQAERSIPNGLAAALRALLVPVIGRIVEGALVLDPRTLEDRAFVAKLPRLAVDRIAP